jgi:tetrahydromethanopterin S-methyltransferase subunit B
MDRTAPYQVTGCVSSFVHMIIIGTVVAHLAAVPVVGLVAVAVAVVALHSRWWDDR